MEGSVGRVSKVRRNFALASRLEAETRRYRRDHATPRVAESADSKELKMSTSSGPNVGLFFDLAQFEPPP